MHANVAAMLLAAGESTRMEELKALLPWEGQPLIEHQVLALSSAGVSRTVVVLGHDAHRLTPIVENHPGVRVVLNPDYRLGKATSLRAGARALLDGAGGAGTIGGAVVLLNVDQPRSADTLRRVIRSHTQTPAACAITIPTYGGKGGHPILLDASLLPELLEVSEETMGLKAVVRRHAAETQRVELEISEVLLDLNTPEEYRRALGVTVI